MSGKNLEVQDILLPDRHPRPSDKPEKPPKALLGVLREGGLLPGVLPRVFFLLFSTRKNPLKALRESTPISESTRESTLISESTRESTLISESTRESTLGSTFGGFSVLGFYKVDRNLTPENLFSLRSCRSSSANFFDLGEGNLRKIWREFCGSFRTHKIKAQNFGEHFGAFFMRNVVPLRTYFVLTSLCRLVTLKV